MPVPIPLLQIDAFTAEPFSGNPAAVCWLDQERDSGWMQRVAAEMNLSETAFLSPMHEGFRLRWFTPVAEIDLCGHGTLASAHALWTWGRLAADQVARFHTRSGWLLAERQGDGIVLDFPAQKTRPVEPPAGLAEALGARPVNCEAGPGLENLVAELDAEDTVRRLRPDFAALGRLPLRRTTVTSRGRDFDFVSRVFVPTMGINEDPVTGSAHCQLATYWNERLGRSRFRAYQASARGGILQVELRGERVRLGGQAVTVFRAELMA